MSNAHSPLKNAWIFLKYNSNIVPGAHIGQAQDRMMNEGSWDEQGNFSFPPQATPEPSQNPNGMRQAINSGPPGDMGQRSHEKIDQFRETPEHQYVTLREGHDPSDLRFRPTNFSTSEYEEKRNLEDSSKVNYQRNWDRQKGEFYSPAEDSYFTQAEAPFDSPTRAEGSSDEEHASNLRQWGKLTDREVEDHRAQREVQPQAGDIHIGHGRDRSDPAFHKAWRVLMGEK